MHNYDTKIRNREKRRVQMQDTGDALAIKRSTTYRLLYQNFSITANQKSTIDTQTNKKNQLRYNNKDSHQTTREQKGKKKEQQKQIQSN